MSINIDWYDVIKKEARGLKDDDIGSLGSSCNDIITKVGIVIKRSTLSQKI